MIIIITDQPKKKGLGNGITLKKSHKKENKTREIKL